MTDLSYLLRPAPSPAGRRLVRAVVRPRPHVIRLDRHARRPPVRESRLPVPGPRARAIVAPSDECTGAVGPSTCRVVHVRTGLRPSGADDVNGVPSAWRLPFAEYVGGIPNAEQHALEGTEWTRFVTEVFPGDEVVSSKKRLSAFYPRILTSCYGRGCPDGRALPAA